MYETEEFIRSNCRQITYGIGRAAVTLTSLVFGLFIIEAAVYWQLEYGERSGEALACTVEEPAEHEGTNGNDCYVAVEGDVCLIEGSALWQMGDHIPSSGRATCVVD